MGANVEGKDDRGRTALWHAAAGGHLDAVDQLLAYDLRITNSILGARNHVLSVVLFSGCRSNCVFG